MKDYTASPVWHSPLGIPEGSDPRIWTGFVDELLKKLADRDSYALSLVDADSDGVADFLQSHAVESDGEASTVLEARTVEGDSALTIILKATDQNGISRFAVVDNGSVLVHPPERSIVVPGMAFAPSSAGTAYHIRLYSYLGDSWYGAASLLEQDSAIVRLVAPIPLPYKGFQCSSISAITKRYADTVSLRVSLYSTEVAAASEQQLVDFEASGPVGDFQLTTENCSAYLDGSAYGYFLRVTVEKPSDEEFPVVDKVVLTGYPAEV